MSIYTLFPGDDFMHVDGSTINNTGIIVDKGTVKMGGNVSATGPADAVNVVTVHDPNDGRRVGGINNAVGPASWVNSNTGLSIGNAPATSNWVGSATISGDTSHGLQAGDIVRVTNTTNYNGTYRFVEATSADNYVINTPYTVPETGNVDVDHVATGVGGDQKDVGHLAAGSYAIRMVDLEIFNGSAIVNTLNTPASEYGRAKAHGRKAVRTRNVEFAIRAGHWIPFSGVFNPAPPTANDFAAFGVDSEITHSPSGWGLLGEYAYRYGVTTTTGNYPPDQDAP